jgi:hypothetical protein
VRSIASVPLADGLEQCHPGRDRNVETRQGAGHRNGDDAVATVANETT